jgi:hypothetical protein
VTDITKIFLECPFCLLTSLDERVIVLLLAQGTTQRQTGEKQVKITLTEKQLDTILEAIDFWQGSLIGIEDYKEEYRRAEKIDQVIRDKARKARAEAELKETEKALTRAIQLFNINDPEQVREVTALKMRLKELRA